MNLYLKEKHIIMKQITLIIILTILSSCGTKKQITKSSIETNTIEQIDDSININTSHNTTTQTNDSTEVTIEELIEETISDTLNHQTIKRTTKRKETIRKSGNARIEQSDESYTTHNKHIQNKEKKKEVNKSKNIKQYPLRKYLLIMLVMIVAVLIYRFTRNRRQ